MGFTVVTYNGSLPCRVPIEPAVTTQRQETRAANNLEIFFIMHRISCEGEIKRQRCSVINCILEYSLHMLQCNFVFVNLSVTVSHRNTDISHTFNSLLHIY